MNRRSFLKKALGSIAAMLGLSGGTYYYAREIEPSMLKINEQVISSPKIPSSFKNFKIVQFSDTHIGFHYTIDQLTELVKTINDQQPDIIVFTGDLVDDPDNYHWNPKLTNVLKSLTAFHGKFWIYGNHDHGGYGTNIVRNVMEQADFQLLQNNHIPIQIKGKPIILAGIDDVILGKPDLNATLNPQDKKLFTILLAHEPDFADTTTGFPVDVQLSGHSHGGQVRFPFIGHLYTPIFAEKYVQGKYVFTNEDLTLFVNKGIGTTRLPYRFLCKPEIHVYTLEN